MLLRVIIVSPLALLLVLQDYHENIERNLIVLNILNLGFNPRDLVTIKFNGLGKWYFNSTQRQIKISGSFNFNNLFYIIS